MTRKIPEHLRPLYDELTVENIGLAMAGINE